MVLYQVIVPVAQVALKETDEPEQIFVLLTETAVGVFGAVQEVIVKLLFEMSKKALLAPFTMIRAVVELTFGIVTMAEPLFGTFDASGVG